jgi:hypothetical protein
LTNQLGIHLILTKQEKLVSNTLANQLGNTHLTTRIYARADRGCHRRFPVGGKVKKEIKNYVKLLEKNSFFTWHFFLEVGKTQDLSSKIWQTLGDALFFRITQYDADAHNTHAHSPL